MCRDCARIELERARGVGNGEGADRAGGCDDHRITDSTGACGGDADHNSVGAGQGATQHTGRGVKGQGRWQSPRNWGHGVGGVAGTGAQCRGRDAEGLVGDDAQRAGIVLLSQYYHSTLPSCGTQSEQLLKWLGWPSTARAALSSALQGCKCRAGFGCM